MRMQHHNIASSLIWHCFDIVCLSDLLNFWKLIWKSLIRHNQPKPASLARKLWLPRTIPFRIGILFYHVHIMYMGTFFWWTAHVTRRLCVHYPHLSTPSSGYKKKKKKKPSKRWQIPRPYRHISVTCMRYRDFFFFFFVNWYYNSRYIKHKILPWNLYEGE